VKKTAIIYLALYLVISFNAFSQTQMFKAGSIITKSQDTINALIELSISYDKYVRYKAMDDQTISEIKVSEVLSLKTPYNVFKKFKIEGHERLFRESVKGKFLLFENIEMYNSGTTLKTGNMTWERQDSKYTYIFIADSNEYVLRKKKDLEKISKYISKCTEANEIVTNRSFLLDQLAEAVTQLNRCE
jgi:hypothetical protein